MTPSKNRIALIIIAPIIVGAIFLLCGVVFWLSNPHESWLTCVYSDKDCSLTVATWALADVTLAAFIAAAVAAFFAVNAYELETDTVLGHKMCAQAEHRLEPDVTLYFTSKVRRPQRFSPVNLTGYHPEHHAFLNLSRTSLVEVTVRYSIEIDGKAKPFLGTLNLDCIPVDGETHVTLYFRNGFTGIKTTWLTPAKQGMHYLTFFPGKGYSSAASEVPVAKRRSLPEKRDKQ